MIWLLYLSLLIYDLQSEDWINTLLYGKGFLKAQMHNETWHDMAWHDVTWCDLT